MTDNDLSTNGFFLYLSYSSFLNNPFHTWGSNIINWGFLMVDIIYRFVCGLLHETWQRTAKLSCPITFYKRDLNYVNLPYRVDSQVVFPLHVLHKCPSCTRMRVLLSAYIRKWILLDIMWVVIRRSKCYVSLRIILLNHSLFSLHDLSKYWIFLLVKYQKFRRLINYTTKWRILDIWERQ